MVGFWICLKGLRRLSTPNILRPRTIPRHPPEPKACLVVEVVAQDGEHIHGGILGEESKEKGSD